MLLIPEELQGARDSWCGPAALTAVLRYLGVSTSQEKIAEAAGTNDDGTSIDALALVAREAGLDAVIHADLTTQQQLALLAAGTPIIASCRVEDESHWVVLRGIDAAGVHLMDPACGNVTLALSEWEKDREPQTLAIRREQVHPCRSSPPV